MHLAADRFPDDPRLRRHLRLTGPVAARGRCYTRRTMTQLLGSILEQVSLTTVVDIGITALLIYWLFSLIRGTRAVRLVIGVSVLIVVYALAVAFDLRPADPDPPGRRGRRPVRPRRRLPAGAAPGARAHRAGRLVRAGSSRRPSRAPSSHVAAEVARAAAGLSADGHGALIVLERETGLEEVAETGVMIHGDLSADLLRTIFTPRTRAPRRRGDHPRRRASSPPGALLPLAETTIHTERFGTRHRAALGITEQTDARRRRGLRGERPDQPRRARRIVRNLNEAAARPPRLPGARSTRRSRPARQRSAAGGPTRPHGGAAARRAGAATLGPRSSARADPATAARQRRPGPTSDAADAPRPLRRRGDATPPASSSTTGPSSSRRSASRRCCTAAWSCRRAPRRSTGVDPGQGRQPARRTRSSLTLGRPGDRDPLLRADRASVPIASTFTATVDLDRRRAGQRPGRRARSQVDVGRRAGSRSSATTRDVVTVQLDDLVTRDDVPVDGRPRHRRPTGSSVGDDDRRRRRRSSVSGPASVVDQVVGVRGRRRRSSRPGIDVDQDVLLVPIDKLGDAVSPVDVDAARPRACMIPVFSDRQIADRCRSTRSSPATPAAGFEIASVTVDCRSSVTVEGDADQLAELTQVDTDADLRSPGSSTTRSIDRRASRCRAGSSPLGDDAGHGDRHAPPGDRHPDVRGRASSSSATAQRPRLRAVGRPRPA